MRVVTWEELGATAPGWERSLSHRLDLVLLDEKVVVETAHHVLFMTPSDRGYCDLTVVVGGKILGDFSLSLVGRKVSLDLWRIEGFENEEPVETVSADGTVTYSCTSISRLYELREEVLLTVR